MKTVIALVVGLALGLILGMNCGARTGHLSRAERPTDPVSGALAMRGPASR